MWTPIFYIRYSFFSNETQSGDLPTVRIQAGTPLPFISKDKKTTKESGLPTLNGRKPKERISTLPKQVNQPPLITNIKKGRWCQPINSKETQKSAWPLGFARFFLSQSDYPELRCSPHSYLSANGRFGVAECRVKKSSCIRRQCFLHSTSPKVITRKFSCFYPMYIGLTSIQIKWISYVSKNCTQ